jgi:hypothetical protein
MRRTAGTVETVVTGPVVNGRTVQEAIAQIVPVEMVPTVGRDLMGQAHVARVPSAGTVQTAGLALTGQIVGRVQTDQIVAPGQSELTVQVARSR